MKVGKSVIQFGLAIVVLVSIGCDSANLNLNLSSTNELARKMGSPPLAVLSIAPAQTWFTNVLSLTNNSEEPVAFSDEQIQKKFPGIDIGRPAAAFLYLSDKGAAEPLVYFPVHDYERFLDELDRRFPMKRAIVSRFKAGKYQLRVKQIGEYAVIGTSTEGIKQGPNSPEPYLQELPTGFDFVFKWQDPDSTRKQEKKRLVRSVRSSFGEAFSQLLSKSDSMVCCLKIDSDSRIELHGQLDTAPENSDELETQMNDILAEQGWTTSTETKDDQLLFDVAIPSDIANSAWATVQPAVTNFFNSQYRMLVKSSRASPQRIRESGSLSNFAGSIVSGDSMQPSSGGGQRSGGG